MTFFSQYYVISPNILLTNSDRKLIDNHSYQGSQYAFNPNTTVYVKRFVDTPIGTSAVRNKEPLNKKEMYFGDMQKCFSHYYRSGSLYVRNTDKQLDGDRMLKLRVIARKRMNEKIAMEEMLRKKKKSAKKAKIKRLKQIKRPKSSVSRRKSHRNKSNSIEVQGMRPMTR